VETTRALVRLFKSIEPNTHLSAGSIVELARLPAVVLSGPVAVEKKRLARDAERLTAIDMEEMEAAREVPPRWYDLQFDVALSCRSTLELVEMMERCSRLVQASPLLTAEGGGRVRRYVWAWRTPPGVRDAPDISQVAEGRGELAVFDVEAYSGLREISPLIRVVDIGIESPDGTDEVKIGE